MIDGAVRYEGSAILVDDAKFGLGSSALYGHDMMIDRLSSVWPSRRRRLPRPGAEAGGLPHGVSAAADAVCAADVVQSRGLTMCAGDAAGIGIGKL